jgi:hypothetical protein
VDLPVPAAAQKEATLISRKFKSIQVGCHRQLFKIEDNVSQCHAKGKWWSTNEKAPHVFSRSPKVPYILPGANQDRLQLS